MKIVVTEPEMMAREVQAALASVGEVIQGPFSDLELQRVLPDCEVLMVRLGHFVGESIIRRAPKLRFIVTATTGLDHIDQKVARAAGVRVISLRDCADQIQDVSATAELTWALLLALVRAVPAAAGHTLGGGWDRNQFWGRQLKGKQLGVIGHGRIGSMVAGYGAAFGMNVVACDVIASKVVPPARPVSLDQLLETSDVVSVHVTADPQNRHLVGASSIAKMKPGAFLVNSARGMIVDGAAAAAAVTSRRLAGVAVDVLEGEEHRAIDGDPLIACARAGYNVLITPHIGGATRESIALTEAAVVTELRRALQASSG
jgi:D-3-phosphoglycerate dehydrogenase